MSRPFLTGAVFGAALLGAAFLLNPSADRHRDKIKAALAERSQLNAVLGVGTLVAFASNYHSLGVASYTTAGDQTLSFGVLGMVFVLD
ncbi:hypothetical protein ACLIIZ_12080 [Azonexus caeni]|uniref:hypothetical protein n=1 Tax=Azonexus caeni TaxID=266126 RepID=UPI003A8BC9E8